MMNPDDCKALGLADGDRVEVGNERGRTIVNAKAKAGQQKGVVVVEGIWPNRRFDGGIGINALTSADPGWPHGGAVFHDTAVWIRKAEEEPPGLERRRPEREGRVPLRGSASGSGS